MATIQNIRQRAQQLAEKWQKLSISPEEVGLLIDDLAALVNDAVINGSSLGIRRTYDSLSAMNSDGTAPNDQWGDPLKRGQLVAIASTDADAGKIYLFADPNWAYVTTVDARYVTVDALEEVNNKLTELGNKASSVGYVTCDTVAAASDKTLVVEGITALTTGIRLLIKMTNHNTAGNATLNINSLGAKPLFYNGVRVNSDNAWKDGDIIDVYYDGTNFQATDFQGGAGREEIERLEQKVEEVGVRNEDYEEGDFGVSDESGNLILELKDGHIRTRNFDSRNAGSIGSEDTERKSDLEIVDENNNVLVQFFNGHIRTKNFDSSNISVSDNGGYEIKDTPANTYDYAIDESTVKQKYLGGYVEIQPDSWDGTVPSVDDKSNIWGFPYSLIPSEIQRASEVLGNIQYIRFPLGFAYRGVRNVDEGTSLGKNIGERFPGQNYTLKLFFEKIIRNGGGLAPEYWCLPQYWITSGKYDGVNEVWAGGDYPRSTTLSSIKNTDSEQYNTQIDNLTDAIVDDLEYLHTNIAPVRMFGLSNEPQYKQQPYGACGFDDITYSDILSVLVPKIRASSVLSNYNGVPNNILLHVSSSDTEDPWSIGKTFISEHEDYIWAYTHHHMRNLSGESGSLGADVIKTTDMYHSKNGKPVFCNEYEYFTNAKDDNYRCSNLMLKMLNEFCLGLSQVAHPVIHIAKPVGQNLPSTNTKGYSLLIYNKDDELDDEFKLAKGTFVYNATMYNGWSFIKNLPIGSYRVGEDCITDANGVQFCVFKHSTKLYVLAANRNSVANSVRLTFSSHKKFKGELYSINNNAIKLTSLNGAIIDFIIPAYSGVFYEEI